MIPLQGTAPANISHLFHYVLFFTFPEEILITIPILIKAFLN